jgi:hypothetical protein
MIDEEIAGLLTLTIGCCLAEATDEALSTVDELHK